MPDEEGGGSTEDEERGRGVLEVREAREGRAPAGTGGEEGGERKRRKNLDSSPPSLLWSPVGVRNKTGEIGGGPP